MTAEPVGTGRWGAVHRSEVVFELYSGGLKIPPLCVQAGSMSLVQLCVKANLQKMLKVCAWRTVAEPWDVARLAYAGGSV